MDSRTTTSSTLLHPVSETTAESSGGLAKESPTALLRALIYDMEATLACLPTRGLDPETASRALRYLRLRAVQTKMALAADP